MQTLQTKDYEIFKKHPSNREIDNTNLKKIINSIKFNNRLKYYPITVDNEMRIIDGQHRWLAAKELNEFLYYVIMEDATSSDIIAVNTASKAWDINAYINFYAQEGNENYKKLQQFMTKFHHNAREAMVLLLGNPDQKTRQSFKEGKFEFPNQDVLMRAMEIREKIITIKKYLSIKIIDSTTKRMLKSLGFHYVLLEFLSAKSVDFDLFMKKLEYKLDLIHPCSSRAEYKQILKTIYNWRNSQPLNE